MKLSLVLFTDHTEEKKGKKGDGCSGEEKKLSILRFWDLHFQTLKELDGGGSFFPFSLTWKISSS